VVLVAPAGFRDATGAVHPGRRGLRDDRARARGELADADHLEQVSAEVREHVREPRRELGRVGVGLHVQEVHANAVGELPLAMQREQRLVVAVRVEVRGAVRRAVRGGESALIEVRRDTEARGVAQRVLRAAFLVGQGLQLAQLEQRLRGGVRRLEAARERAVGADRDAFAREELLAERVRDAGPRERQLQIHRVPR
jgi:hypothetical protein